MEETHQEDLREEDVQAHEGVDEASGALEGESEAATVEAENDSETDAQDPLTELQEQNQQLQEEVSELKAQFLRRQADFDNFRKRLLRDKEDSIAFANKDLLSDVVQLLDDFERALSLSEQSRDFDALHDGLAMIEQQFVAQLEKRWGLTRFTSKGEPFDPQQHEAVAMEEQEGIEDSVVVEDYQKGYLYKEKLLRAAKVKVAVPAKK